MKEPQYLPYSVDSEGNIQIYPGNVIIDPSTATVDPSEGCSSSTI